MSSMGKRWLPSSLSADALMDGLLMLCLLPINIFCGFLAWIGYNNEPGDYFAIAVFYWPPLLLLLIAILLLGRPASKWMLIPLGTLAAWEVVMLLLVILSLLEGPDLGTGSYTPSAEDFRTARIFLCSCLLAQGLKLALLGWNMRRAKASGR